MATMGAVGWDLVYDRVEGKVQDFAVHQRAGETDVLVTFGVNRYLPQSIRVASIETSSANANSQIADAVAQIQSNVTFTDQFGDAYSVTVLDFSKYRKTAQLDGNYRVDGIYQIIRYDA